jgi:hypothetical protein
MRARAPNLETQQRGGVGPSRPVAPQKNYTKLRYKCFRVLQSHFRVSSYLSIYSRHTTCFENVA